MSSTQAQTYSGFAVLDPLPHLINILVLIAVSNTTCNLLGLTSPSRSVCGRHIKILCRRLPGHAATHLFLDLGVGDEHVERLLDGGLAVLLVQVQHDVVDGVGPVLGVNSIEYQHTFQ